MVDEKDESEDQSSAFETWAGLVIAVFAAILAINGLGAGKFGDDEQNAIIEKSNQFSWYQSKSIKESLADNQAKTLEAYRKAGLVPPDKEAAIVEMIARLDKKAERYDYETRIILDGSAAHEKDDWFAKMEDDMKNVVGANEYKAQAEGLGGAGDYFDYGELFLQLCVVFGAVCLVLKGAAMRRGFFAAMIVTGLIGTVFTVMAYRAAWAFF